MKLRICFTGFARETFRERKSVNSYAVYTRDYFKVASQIKRSMMLREEIQFEIEETEEKKTKTEKSTKIFESF